MTTILNFQSLQRSLRKVDFKKTKNYFWPQHLRCKYMFTVKIYDEFKILMAEVMRRTSNSKAKKVIH